MNIFEYDLNNLKIEEVARLFEIFKENSEKEGHTAIAIPKDQTIYQDVGDKALYDIQKTVYEELKRRALKESEEYRKSKQEYLGKCFESENQLIKIIDFYNNSKYLVKCLCFDWSEGIDYFYICFENLNLFSKDPQNPKYLIIDRYKEIPEEIFEAKFREKIDEICFGEYRCQD